MFRVAKQRLRESKLQLIDYLILLLAGACLGSIIKSKEETFGAPGYTYSIIAVCKYQRSLLLLLLILILIKLFVMLWQLCYVKLRR